MASQLPQMTHDSPVRVKNVHSDFSYQSDHLEAARLAVLKDLGSFIPMIPFQAFLKHLAPPPRPGFDLGATMQSLRLGPEPALTRSNQWLACPGAPKDSRGSEDDIFSSMPEIFTKVVAAVVANSCGKLTEDDRTVDFLQNPRRAPTSAERRNESKPDGYLVLKDRNKVMSKDGKKEDIFWADITLSCEYKQKDGRDDLDDDVRKCVWSLQQVMRDDARRRASFGMTIENSTTRVWFCCRSAVVVSEAFDFVDEPGNLVKLFAAFAFADQTSLGFDSTIQPVTGNRGQSVVTVHPDNDKQNSRRFRTTEILSSYGAEPLRGRGTRVFQAVEIDGNGEPSGSPVVLKDIWIDSDRTREGNILASLRSETNDEDRLLFEERFLTTICHGDVWTELNILDDTANTLMRGLNITSDHTSRFDLQWQSVIQKHDPTPGSEGLRATMSLVRAPPPPPNVSYAHKTHYRIVFKEKGTTVDSIKNLPEVMTVLTETVGALRLLRKLGWVHRDVSIGNILSCDGHAKLADLEYAKKIGDLETDEMRTGTMQFMPIEVAAQQFLFLPSGPGPSSTEVDKFVSVTGQRVGRARTQVPFSLNHLHDLESLWWVAVWVVFYNYFTPSGDRPDFILRDAEDHLDLARTIFPPVFRDMGRQNRFQSFGLFLDLCDQLPPNKEAIYVRLDLLRKLLIKDYRVIEANCPLSVDLDSSDDGIYNVFTRAFSSLKTVSHDLVLDFIPDIYEELSKVEGRGLEASPV
ncbi:hypothetical protein F5888DRAFT_1720628 [Russula emetica]|nr:hypothetical protein F5888DRAFT_1720628 [Russula emetica]